MARRRNNKVATPIKDKDIGTTVWRACRKGCGGNQATIELKLKLEAGGTRIRYRCENCGHRSMITV
jgi:hypothetical protein